MRAASAGVARDGSHGRAGSLLVKNVHATGLRAASAAHAASAGRPSMSLMGNVAHASPESPASSPYTARRHAQSLATLLPGNRRRTTASAITARATVAMRFSTSVFCMPVRSVSSDATSSSS
jgi:hypothetical protein